MIRPLLLCAALMASVGFANAQETPATAPAQEELLALNFYVQQKDTASTEAELRRLQLKYPAWQPPADLAQLAITAPSTEIDQIFRQIAAGQYDAARATIAETQTRFPDWTPPQDMLALLTTAEGQAKFDQALSAGNLARALELASATPGLLRCDRINNAWRIAEAQQAAGMTAEAMGTYRAIAGACVTPADIVATLEKADAVATPDELVALFAQVEARLPEQAATLAPLRERLLAGKGVVAPAQIAMAPAVPVAPAPAPVATPAPAAAPAPAAPAPAVVAEAPAARAPQGNSGGGTNCSGTYQRAWCAYNLDQPMEAIALFQSAIAGGLGGAQRRDAQYGMALAYLKMQMSEEASRIAAATDFTRTQRIDIERQILDQRGVAAYKKKQYRRAVEYFNALEDLTGSIRRDLAILRAYAYLNGGNRAAARREFRRLNNEMSTQDTLNGLAASE